MGKKRKRAQLTQEEIWDDSALLRSWQDARDEYHYYHSIHAKGENVEDILRQAESDDNAKIEDGAPPRPLDGHASPSGDLEDGEVDELDDIGFSGEAADHCDKPGPLHSSEAHQPDPHLMEKRTASASASMEQGQILENIKMAYWWAGYYSGVYDAKQTAVQSSEKRNAQKTP